MPQQARDSPSTGNRRPVPDYLKGACAVNVLGCTVLTLLNNEKLKDQVTLCAAATQATEAEWVRVL